MKAFGIVILTALVLSSCSGYDVTVNGRFVGYDEQSVFLQKIVPGNQTIADSTRTDEKGSFKFKIKLPGGQPTIYNIICDNQTIPLLLTKGEKVKINSIGNISTNYNIEGSEGSSQMRELKSILSTGAQKLDSLITQYGNVDEETKNNIAAEYKNEYYRTKREHIKFIVTNPGSLASLFALYQRLPNDPDLFNGDSDIIYYRMVADSVEIYHPQSPYLTALKKLIESAESGAELATYIEEQLENATVNYPDINLPDMYGDNHRLSELEGNVIILDFWSASSSEARINNAELRELYEKYKDRGLRIYQVSVDENKSLWVTAVQEQRLPWVTVCDFRGGVSPAAMSYNIRSVPSNYIIDKEGNITATNLYGENLSSLIRRLID